MSTAKEIANQCIEIIHKAGMAGCVVINNDESGQYETTLGCKSPFQKTSNGTLRFQANKDHELDEVVGLLEDDIHNLRAVEHGLDVARDHVRSMRETIQDTFCEELEDEREASDMPVVNPKKDKKYDVN